MSFPSRLDLALSLFQYEAEKVAIRFGVLFVRTGTEASNTDGGTLAYFCSYRLPTYEEWLEAPPGYSPREAVLNLEDALRQQATDFFSSQ